MGTVLDDVESLLTSESLMAHLATCRDGRETGARPREPTEVPVQKDIEGHAEWTVTLLWTTTAVADEAATRETTWRTDRTHGASEDIWGEHTLVRVDVGTATSRTDD